MLLTLQLGSFQLLATTKADYSAKAGQKVYIRLEYSRCNFFDPETEMNIFTGA